ncbi:hypothetical protein MNB_SV-5-715 [hydrothermal vent metagenome]|uniref:Septum formation initiator n=1 Tax=hydrothermal vent metagenome TaxID=652676 RepID=A0A1W1EDS0_9ZZZZ
MSDVKIAEGIAGLSLKTLLVTTIGILLFGIYLGILIYGDNSLTVLNKLKEEKNILLIEGQNLKKNNQELQKEYFELKQLGPSN